MNWRLLLSKCPKRITAITGAVVVLWLLVSTIPWLALQVCLFGAVLAYFSGRVAFARMLAKPQLARVALSPSLSSGIIGAVVGAAVLALGAVQIMPDTILDFFRAAGSMAEVSAKTQSANVDATSSVTQTGSFDALSVPLNIDLSVLIGLVVLVFLARTHLIGAVCKLRERLKGSTQSPHGLAILGLLALGLVTLSGSRAPSTPTAYSTPITSKATDERTKTEKRAALEDQLSEKLTTLRQLEAPLQRSGATSSGATKSVDDMNLWRNSSRPNPAEIEALRADIDKIEKELGTLGP